MARDLQLDQDANALAEVAREFASRTLREAGVQADLSGETPWRTVRAAGEIGLFAPNVPEAYGGPGVSARALAAMMEELGWGNFGIAVTIGSAAVVATAILAAGTEEQKRRYLPRLCSTEEPWVGALALTEPEFGSELEIEIAGTEQHLATRAERSGSTYRLKGAKRFITNGGAADLTALLAVTDSTQGVHGWSLFLIERGTPGFLVGRQIPTMGLRGSYTGEIFLDDCKLPEEARLGREGEGLSIVLKVLQVARPMASSAAIGLARASYEMATAYARDRRQFGKSLQEHQMVAASLAEMRMRIDAARLLVRRAADDLDAGRDAALSAAEAKLFAGETAVYVTQAGLQIFGGYGFTRELPLEMWVRDAFVSRIFFGTGEVQRLEIAQAIARGA